MTRPAFERHNFSDARRLFTVGDIHGRFDLLENELARVSFDPEHDRLVMLGDLVDRGHLNEQALDWCSKPGIHRVLGNHEELVLWATVAGDWGKRNHNNNGGRWFEQITDQAERERWASTLMDAPVAIEAITPGGRRVGFVHADLEISWDEMITNLMSDDEDIRSETATACLWQRTTHKRLMQAAAFDALDSFDCTVAGLDHLFHGHTIVDKPIVQSNRSWIDTGAFAGNGRLTLVDVDAWIEGL